ncbi:MAG TPA: complex I NDUFA9 subunit family protein [Usitatibacter sp.]|nr:complex I NDUFA9 subunit family protein [Usitatibacter sp.]
MDISSVCIIGGTGFVGSAVADQLAARGLRVRIVTRLSQRAAPLLVLPTVEVELADPHDPADLRRCFDNMDAVVNLVGILHESGRQTFQACHVELPRKVAQACRASGVQHLVHMSALGAAADAPSLYQRSKAAGEEAVRAAAGDMAVTIFRPSIIFGEGDRFLNMFAAMARLFPVIPLAGAGARFQPVWVEDVARCVAQAIGDPHCAGKTYELCGPKAYTLEELVRLAGATVGRKPRIVRLPGALASMQAFVLEHLPGKLMTRDNLRSMSVDNVASSPFPAIFGFAPSPLEAVVPEYLHGSAARWRYPGYRLFAGR